MEQHADVPGAMAPTTHGDMVPVTDEMNFHKRVVRVKKAKYEHFGWRVGVIGMFVKLKAEDEGAPLKRKCALSCYDCYESF